MAIVRDLIFMNNKGFIAEKTLNKKDSVPIRSDGG